MSIFSNIFGALTQFLKPFDPLGITSSANTAIQGINAENQHQEDKDWSANQAQLNRDFQTQERLDAQAWNEEMWNKTNEYNSPSARIQRGMAAGINPNSIVGGDLSSPASTVTTSAQSGASAPGVPSFASSLLTSDAQVANLLAQVRKTNADAQGQEIQNSYAPKFNDKALEKAQAEIDKLASDKGFTDEQTRQLKELFPILKGKNIEELNLMKEEVKKTAQEIIKLGAETTEVEANASIAKGKSEFYEKFGVAPGSGLVDGLFQLLTSGDKGYSTVMAMIETLFSTAVGAVSGHVGLFRALDRGPAYVNEQLPVPIIINPN